MLKPGSKVTAEEEKRIQMLPLYMKAEEITRILEQSGRVGDEGNMLASWLWNFYLHPEKYAHVPGTEGDFKALTSRPLPYEGK